MALSQTKLPRTIAIDGPAGSGKSTVSFILACDLNYLFVDTGAFYRAVTLAAIQSGQVEQSDEVIVDIAHHAQLDITPNLDADGRQYTLLLNGEDVTWDIRQREVEKHVSRISAIGGVREILNQKYRELAMRGSVIMAGRDIGTQVLPDADLKIYLDASPEARAERRYRQRVEAGQEANYDEILGALHQRDAYDSQRAIAPLTQAVDAHYVSTDNLDIIAVVDEIKRIIEQCGKV